MDVAEWEYCMEGEAEAVGEPKVRWYGWEVSVVLAGSKFFVEVNLRPLSEVAA
jgi:hypothetical protein